MRDETSYARRVGLGAVANGGYVLRGAKGTVEVEKTPSAVEEPAERTAERPTAKPSEASSERLSRVANDPYKIARSGRPSASGRSSLAYDGDPGTIWAMEDATGSAYAWFDLGSERSVAAVRWLGGPKGGRVEIQVSSDRSRWETVGEWSLADRTWQSVRVDEAARYVRFVFDRPEDGVEAAELAEIEIYGPPGADASDPREREPRAETERVAPSRADGAAGRTEDAETVDGDSAGDADVGDADRSRTRVTERSAAGEGNDPRANRERSDNNEGNVRIVEPDVVEERTIEVSVEPGTAICDESGGDGNKAGRGRGASAGNGGACREDASGGAVEIGDINP